MNQYMVTIDLPAVLTGKFFALIPEQRRRVDELMAEGRILAYTLAVDRSRLWVTVRADTKGEVVDLINSMPLGKFMTAAIQELAFHRQQHPMTMPLSLN